MRLLTSFRSRWLLQGCGIDGHLSQPLAGRGKDCISDCRNDGRSPGLTHPAWRLGALNDVNLDRGCLIDAQHLVVVEVALLNTAVLQRDLAVERCRAAK